MVPQFQLMQERIDRVNQVLREQITGIRVVRAFVREPDEAERFGGANDDLTDTSLRAGRLMAFMFPTVTARAQRLERRRASGSAATASAAASMQIGALIAFLSYLIQILMSVMMATFVAVLVPRGRRCAPSASRRCSTPQSSVVAPADARSPSCTSAASLELRDVGLRLPGRRGSGALRHLVRPLGPARPRPSSAAPARARRRCSTWCPRLFDATGGAVLVDGVDVRDLEPELLWSRIGLVPQKPYLFSGTVASNLRYANPDATDDELWEALEIAQARDFVAAHARRPRRPHRPGRHERVGRPAPAPGHRPGARAQARDLPVRRLVLGARPRHRRPAAGRARARAPPTPRS